MDEQEPARKPQESKSDDDAGLAVGSYCVALGAALVMLEELEKRQFWRQCLCLELDYLGQLIAIGVLRDSNYYVGELGNHQATYKAEVRFYMLVVVYMAACWMGFLNS